MPPTKEVWAKPGAVVVDVVGVGMDVPVELLDIVTRLFATHSEDFIDGNFAVFPELEAKMGQVGAGRAG